MAKRATKKTTRERATTASTADRQARTKGASERSPKAASPKTKSAVAKPRSSRTKHPSPAMSGLDAAAKVLSDSKEPMRVKDIVELAQAKGLWTSPGGKTPAATISAAIGREIRDKGKESRFEKVGRGYSQGRRHRGSSVPKDRRRESDSTDIDLARLPKMAHAELRNLWAKYFRGKPPPSRNLLIREIAWRTQEQRDGGLDAETRRLLKAAMRAAVAGGPRSKRGEEVVAGDESAPQKRRRRKPTTSPKLPAAARLVREWGGVQHEVIVVEDGRAYRYRDQTYRSLTAVAREITGTHRSGPMFFGLSSYAGRRATSDNGRKRKDGKR